MANTGPLILRHTSRYTSTMVVGQERGEWNSFLGVFPLLKPSRINLHRVLIYMDVYLDLNFTPITALQLCCLIYVHKTSYIYKKFVLNDNIGVLTTVNKG